VSSNNNDNIFESILKTVLQKRDHPHHRAIDKERSHSLFLSFALFNFYDKTLTSSIKQSGEECWVRFGSSTWNVLWTWSDHERRLRLSKITKEIKLEVLMNSQQVERSWTLKTLFIVELYLRIYCTMMLRESNETLRT